MAPAEAWNGAEELRRIRRLRQRCYRDRCGLYFVEGMRQVFCALDAGLPVETIVYSETLAPTIVQKGVRQAKRAGIEVLRVAPDAFRSISIAPHASGVGAVLPQHWTTIREATAEEGLCWIGMGRSRNPGNLGTMLRTAEAAGVGGVIFLEPATDPFDERVVRASMGGIFGLRLVRAGYGELQSWARRWGCRIIGTSPHASTLYSDAGARYPVVFLFGEERSGLTDGELSLCHETVRIPTTGRADSLNVGVAAGVILFDLHRRRAEAVAEHTR